MARKPTLLRRNSLKGLRNLEVSGLLRNHRYEDMGVHLEEVELAKDGIATYNARHPLCGGKREAII